MRSRGFAIRLAWSSRARSAGGFAGSPGSEDPGATSGSEPVRSSLGSEPVRSSLGSEPVRSSLGSEPVRSSLWTWGLRTQDFCARGRDPRASAPVTSGFGSISSRIWPSRSWHALMNCRSVRRVGGKVSNSRATTPPRWRHGGSPGTSRAPRGLPAQPAVDAGLDRHVARVEPLLPHVRRRDHDVAADELAPVHVVAEGGREQADAVAALLEQPVSLLEHRDTRPFEARPGRR